MEKEYNRIVIIGNGYDIALGLKTSYKDFALYYFKDLAIQTLKGSPFYETSLLSVEKKNTHFTSSINEIENKINGMTNVKDILEYMFIIGTITYKHPFFRFIINEFKKENWVDIEVQYFKELSEQYEKYKQNSKKSDLSGIKSLNECMDKITKELHKFILIQQESVGVSYLTSHMSSLIDEIKEPLRYGSENLLPKHNRKEPPTKVIFVNFNYTNTVIKIINNSFIGNGFVHINIHGSVNDYKNPIIFGYGDETNKIYQKLQEEDIEELIRKIKSVHYYRTKNNLNLIQHLNSNEFDVFIVGHSCGISDRTLLNKIFEHDNCIGIKCFHYKGVEEVISKSIQITGHFTDKNKTENRLLPFDELATIPQLFKKSLKAP